MREIPQLLGSIHPSLSELQGVPLYVFLLVIAFTAVFALGYLIKGSQVWYQLWSAGRRIHALRANQSPPRPEEVARILKWEPFKHLWQEYSDTLHELRKASSAGGTLTEVRATVPAETMFTREVLVDSRLFDDFTRHLPGVLTGLGIIGTFAGLLNGLQKFDPSTTAKAVEGLGPLMTGVQHAFVASGAAIACAMGVVFVSRLLLAYLYHLTGKLTHGIDSLYATGAGEEYLARLVKSSEQSAASTAQLKDALVEDLNKMMTNLVERQIAAQEAATSALGDRIGESISSAIAEPMKRVSSAIEATTKGNGEQVNGMLETLLTGFMAKLEDTFGGQMRGINEQMQRSMDAMAAVQASLQGLLADIQTANERAANQMSGTLEEAMRKAAGNQELLTEQMRGFVQEFQKLAAEQQNDSRRSMDDVVMKVLGEVSSSMAHMENIRKAASAEESGRNERLTTQTTQLVGDLSTNVESLLTAVSDQVSRTQQNIEALGRVSTRAIDGMNQGAATMGSAAQRFETAGTAVTQVFDRSSKVAEVLGSASATLQAASSAVQRGFEQYDSTRRTVDAQVASLMGLIESAKREAGISQDLVASIKASADAMRQAEAESRDHLEKVNDALVKAFSDFGNSLVGQVRSTIAETDRHLGQGVGHLTGVVQELASAVHRMKQVA
jgi:hypothetical protein